MHKFGVLQDTGRGKKRKQGPGEGSPMYSGGEGWGHSSGKNIAEAGMILRDPSALHIIIKQAGILLRAYAFIGKVPAWSP